MAKCGGGCSCSCTVVKVAALGGRQLLAGFFLFQANLRAHQTLVLRCSFNQQALQKEGGVRFSRRVRSLFMFLFRFSFLPLFYRLAVVLRSSRSRRRRFRHSAPGQPAPEIVKRGEGGGSMMMIAVSCFSFLPCTLRLRG